MANVFALLKDDYAGIKGAYLPLIFDLNIESILRAIKPERIRKGFIAVLIYTVSDSNTKSTEGFYILGTEGFNSFKKYLSQNIDFGNVSDFKIFSIKDSEPSPEELALYTHTPPDKW